jgi:hypothetical protein
MISLSEFASVPSRRKVFSAEPISSHGGYGKSSCNVKLFAGRDTRLGLERHAFKFDLKVAPRTAVYGLL